MLVGCFYLVMEFFEGMLFIESLCEVLFECCLCYFFEVCVVVFYVYCYFVVYCDFKLFNVFVVGG